VPCPVLSCYPSNTIIRVWTGAAPRIVSFTADDPTDLDNEYGEGDLLRISFDQVRRLEIT
jgi:hypothetical protein